MQGAKINIGRIVRIGTGTTRPGEISNRECENCGDNVQSFVGVWSEETRAMVTRKFGTT
jgi:hypothetical protein